MEGQRITANIPTQELAAARRFYEHALGLDLLMDHGWIATYGSREQRGVQIRAAQGGSGTAVPDLSIEVDDVEAALDRMRGGRVCD